MKTETLACSTHLRIVFMFFLPGAQLLILGANVRSWNWLHFFVSVYESITQHLRRLPGFIGHLVTKYQTED